MGTFLCSSCCCMQHWIYAEKKRLRLSRKRFRKENRKENSSELFQGITSGSHSNSSPQVFVSLLRSLDGSIHLSIHTHTQIDILERWPMELCCILRCFLLRLLQFIVVAAITMRKDSQDSLQTTYAVCIEMHPNVGRWTLLFNSTLGRTVIKNNYPS